MRIARTLSPAAAPLYLHDITTGILGAFCGGAEMQRFENELKEYFGVRHCFLVSSGKAALAIILGAIKKGSSGRDAVLIPAFSCYSIPSAIVRARLKVELCDVDPLTLDYDYKQLTQMLSGKQSGAGSTLDRKKLLAVIATHLFGCPARVKEVRAKVNDPEVVIIEDAAQAMGEDGENGKLGTSGDISILSLGRGKSLSTLAGGVILTDRDDLAEKIQKKIAAMPQWKMSRQLLLAAKSLVLYLFQHPHLFWIPKLIPFLKLGETIYDPQFEIKKMTPFQAGLARNWRKKLHAFQRVRSDNGRALNEKLRPLYHCYCAVGKSFPALLRFPLLVKNKAIKEQILSISQRNGLGIMPTYPDSINKISHLQNFFIGQEYPGAKKLSSLLITLPVHPFVCPRDRQRIIDVLLAVQKKTSVKTQVNRHARESVLAALDG